MKITASAPGKLILAGEHSVVYGEPALATAIDLRTTVTVETEFDYKNPTCPDEKIILVDLHSFKALGISIRYYGNLFHAENLKERGFSSQVQSSVTAIVAAINMLGLTQQINCKISISSTIPLGCGLGSSAAFSVALSAALMQLTGCFTTPIGEFANKVETTFHENPSGIDTHVSQQGGLVRFQKNLYYNDNTAPNRSPRRKVAKNSNKKFMISKVQLEECDEDMQVSIVNTNVTRSTKTLVNKVRKNYTINKEFIDHCCKAITALVNETQDKLQGGNISGAEDTLLKNHHLLNAIGVGHSSLDTAHALAHNKYDIVLKTTGAGGGGCMFALRELPKALKEELEAQQFTVFQTNMMAPGLSVKIS